MNVDVLDRDLPLAAAAKSAERLKLRGVGAHHLGRETTLDVDRLWILAAAKTSERLHGGVVGCGHLDAELRFDLVLGLQAGNCCESCIEAL